MWVTNTSATTGWHKNYTLNDVINPGGSLPNLGTSLSLTALTDKSYDLNVVTERGSTASFKILSPKDNAFRMSLFTMPRTVSPGQNVTILFGVANNVTNGGLVHSITPPSQLSWTTIADVGPTTPSATRMEGPIPTTERSLTIGETIFFKYVYKINGDSGDKMRLNATITNAKQGNYITEQIEIADPLQSGQAQNAVFSALSQQIGSIMLEHDTLAWTNTNGDDQSGIHTEGYPGFGVLDDEKIMWSVNFTNKDPLGRNLTLNKNTFLQTTGTGGGTKEWYICDGLKSPPQQGKIQEYDTTNPVVLTYNATTTVYFGDADPQSGDGAEATPSPTTEGLLIVLSGGWDDDSVYGQTLPFTATRVSPSSISLSPTSGSGSTSITISGSGFDKPNKRVDIYWINNDGSYVFRTFAMTTASGDIPGGITFTPAGTELGWHVVYATDGVNPAFASFNRTS
jgi:hypothetical protein